MSRTRLLFTLLASLVAAALVSTPAFAHFLGYSSVRNRAIVYQDKTRYDTERQHAIDVWNNLGSVKIKPDTVFTLEDLEFRDFNDCSSDSIGVYQYDPVFSDDVALNICNMDAVGALWRRHTVGEELGHGLGLGHSYCGQLVDPTCDGSTKVDTPQSHDIADYRQLWG